MDGVIARRMFKKEVREINREYIPQRLPAIVTKKNTISSKLLNSNVRRQTSGEGLHAFSVGFKSNQLAPVRKKLNCYESINIIIGIHVTVRSLGSLNIVANHCLLLYL